MTENADGSLTVSSNEVVTVTVTKQFAPFAATFTPLVGASWNGSVASNGGLTETNTFIAPATPGAIITATIMYDFIPDGTGNVPAGDRYHQTVTGSAGGSATPIDVFPPGISGQTLVFNVI